MGVEGCGDGVSDFGFRVSGLGSKHPAGQAQVKLPSVFVQVACSLQLSLSLAHSLKSQTRPSPSHLLETSIHQRSGCFDEGRGGEVLPTLRAAGSIRRDPGRDFPTLRAAGSICRHPPKGTGFWVPGRQLDWGRFSKGTQDRFWKGSKFRALVLLIARSASYVCYNIRHPPLRGGQGDFSAPTHKPPELEVLMG